MHDYTASKRFCLLIWTHLWNPQHYISTGLKVRAALSATLTTTHLTRLRLVIS